MRDTSKIIASLLLAKQAIDEELEYWQGLAAISRTPKPDCVISEQDLIDACIRSDRGEPEPK